MRNNLKDLTYPTLVNCIVYTVYYAYRMFVFICSGPRFEQTSAAIMLPDDCTVGFIVERRLGFSMVHSNMFHSHLENLLQISPSDIPKQVR